MLALALTVHIGVFGLFHPHDLELKPAPGQVLVVETGGQTQTLESGHALRLHGPAHATGRGGAPAVFVLSVPGRIRREFAGRLEVSIKNGELVPVVEMDRERALATILAAELPPMPLEAVKAQAVAARSFLSAGAHHQGFDFCDTTHCQVLRDPPRADSSSIRAADQTRGLVLTYNGHILAALYSANCGGHTRDLTQAGWNADPSGYPYFGVSCLRGGAVAGHQIGLCQSGAADMARLGSSFGDILAHFYPAAALTRADR